MGIEGRGREHNMTKATEINKLNIKQLAKDYPNDIAGMFVIAKYYKAKYDTLIQVGFNAQQALDILKARGLNV